MMRKAAVAAALLLVAFLLTRCSHPPVADDGRAFGVGQPAPSFRLADLQGTEVSLSDFKGKVVLLDFWATWCGPCRMTMPLLEKLQSERPNDFTLLAINLEEPRDEVRSYVQRRGLHSRVLLDTEGEVGRAYGSDSIPMQVLIDREGVVRDIRIGYHPALKDALASKIEELKSN